MHDLLIKRLGPACKRDSGCPVDASRREDTHMTRDHQPEGENHDQHEGGGDDGSGPVGCDVEDKEYDPGQDQGDERQRSAHGNPSDPDDLPLGAKAKHRSMQTHRRHAQRRPEHRGNDEDQVYVELEGVEILEAGLERGSEEEVSPTCRPVRITRSSCRSSSQFRSSRSVSASSRPSPGWASPIGTSLRRQIRSGVLTS